MNFEEFRVNFEREIASASSPANKIETIVTVLSACFSVGRDEVAIFSYDKNREMLVFVWPHSLKSVGCIPLNAHRCFVAKTAAGACGGIDNNFASTPHLYMFEHFISDKEKRVPIQKIMSVPVVDGEQLKGVVQIARKGAGHDSAGADFTAKNLESLNAIASIIGRHI